MPDDKFVSGDGAGGVDIIVDSMGTGWCHGFFTSEERDSIREFFERWNANNKKIPNPVDGMIEAAPKPKEIGHDDQHTSL